MSQEKGPTNNIEVTPRSEVSAFDWFENVLRVLLSFIEVSLSLKIPIKGQYIICC